VRIQVISDIHSNLEALEAVLQHAQQHGPIREVWCLGDIVGYGPNPRECIAIVQEKATVCIAGNHDLGAIGKIGLETFNAVAATACRWTGQQLTPGEQAFLNALEPKTRRGEFTLAHGSPREPIWEYVVSIGTALASFSHFQTEYCLVGHSHIPFLCAKDPRLQNCHFYELPSEDIVVLGAERLILNPGSVGQPRDGNPKASYLIYDTELRAVAHHRVDYPIATTQEKILKAGLPQQLAERLSYGR
jgi:diadenosine tetraphosphatase ApaH/serine/threonine PP2A family protein phosphatase